MTAASEAGLGHLGIMLGELQGVAAGIMRVSSNESIYGRAVAIAAGEKVPGDRNFDLCSDWEGEDVGREILGHRNDGVISGLQLVGQPIYKIDKKDVVRVIHERMG
ncbi:hypothetical protein CC78DRAFT_544485 [Lojkania enalia]|uniref:Uncharacterized protein n=1 Tax=Lojkania enalia TaxID=147567 RepID=A0A9P4N876_9PLEO|nr:hypothetical protein CC78DRAFT_544485 [Didymosphaeria enalia]